MIPDNLQPPEGCVILGWGGTFKNGGKSFHGYSFWPSTGNEWRGPNSYFGNQGDMIYAAPSDSEIDRLNSPGKTEGSDTPRVDAEELRMQDSPSIPEDHIVHSNFARTLERQLAAKDALISELRSIFPAICKSLGNGAFCTGNNSIEFLREIPKEVALVIKSKDALIEELHLDIRDRDHAIRHLAKGVDFERKMPNETRPIIREALSRAGKEGR